jgi:uncharacterized protein
VQYYRASALQWDKLAPCAVIRVRPHRVVELEQSILLLSSDSPGWAAIPYDQFQALNQIDGLTVGQLKASDLVQPEQSLVKLYAAGLLAIDGRTGLSGNSECCHSNTAAPRGGAGEPRDRVKSSSAPELPNTLLIKLTGACNWACTYCYDYETSRFRESIRLEDIASAIEQIIAHHSQVTLMFHGGEPLLQFSELKRIVEFTKECCKRLSGSARYSLQTNGSLITEEIIGFLDAHSFDVGMSIDGPPRLNDLTRVDHLGRGTAYALEGLFWRQREFMTTRVGFITTVTSRNVNELAEVATYLRDLGVQSWKTAIFDVEGRGRSFPKLCPRPEPYVEFLNQWLDECELGEWGGFRYKNILELIDTIASPHRPNLCLRFPCGAGRDLMVASADGQLMACDATYNPLFVLGGKNNTLTSAQGSPNAVTLFEREEWLLTEAECATCPWLHYCAGTCMAKALIQHGTIKSVDDFECTVRKAIFPRLFDKLVKPNSGLRSYYLASGKSV